MTFSLSFLYSYIRKCFIFEFLRITISKLDASCKACIWSISSVSSADIFPLAWNSWPFPLALPPACKVMSEGICPLWDFRKDRWWCFLLCILLFPSFPHFWPVLLITFPGAASFHIFPHLPSLPSSTIFEDLEKFRMMRKANSAWIALRLESFKLI